MKKSNEDFRRDLYIKALVAYINSGNSTTKANMKLWADEALSAYDSNFADEVW